MALLSHQLIEANEGRPRSLLLVAHGIFGRGQNWRTIARKLCARCPGWGVAAVDLRGHGLSSELAGPPTIAAAATDLVETARQLGRQRAPVSVLLGHSFGGKVVLLAREALGVDQTWLIDSSPSANPAALENPVASAPAALVVLEDVERSFSAGFESRSDFVSELERRGVSVPIGHFLAMNLARSSNGRFRFAIDLKTIRALLTDYFAADAWPQLQRPGGEVHVVVAGRGSALSAADQARLAGTATELDELSVHRIEDSGHWVHADAPLALLDLLSALLPQSVS